MWRSVNHLPGNVESPGHRVVMLQGDDRRLSLSALLETASYLPGDVDPTYDAGIPLTDEELGLALIALGSQLAGLQIRPQ